MSVTEVIHDLYATPETVKDAVKRAKEDLANNQVQQARAIMQDLASETDIHIANVPLATYPAAINTVVPLIDARKIEEAKGALLMAIHTLVIETYVIPLPKIRAQAMLSEADKLAGKNNRNEQENMELHNLIEASRQQIQLAEALGYGNKDSYKPLYAQLDDIKKKTEGGKSARGLFNRIHDSLKNFKFSV